MKFLVANDHPDFPSEERSTLSWWTEIDAFKTSLRQSKDKTPFAFYDGPPFATGLPRIFSQELSRLTHVVKCISECGSFVSVIGW